MSLFNIVPLPCPACGESVNFNAVFSVNADRRPDLRAAIMDGSFQREECPKCGTGFRLDPELTYLDVAGGQWIGAFPVTKLSQWKQLQEQTRATFARSYTDNPSPAARAIGARLTPRLTFGWSATREKLLAKENQLDDVTLELLKTAILRGMDEPPVEADTELRLVDIDGDEFVIAWIRPANEEVVEMLRVPRTLYDEINAAPEDWQALRETLSDGPFVDIAKLLVPAAAPTPISTNQGPPDLAAEEETA